MRQPGHPAAAILRFAASNVVIGGTSAVLGIVLTRTLGPADAGKLTFLTQMALVGVPLLSLSLPDALAVVGPSLSEPERRAAVARCRALLVGFLAVFTLACVIAVRLGKAPRELAIASAPALLFAWATGLWTLEAAALRATGAFGAITGLSFLRDVVGRSAAIGLVLLSGATSYETALWALGVTSVTALLWAVAKNGLPLFLATPLPASIKAFARRNLLGLSIYMALQGLDVAALRLADDPSVVGTYAAGVKVPSILYSLLSSQLAVPFTFYFSGHWAARRVSIASRGSVLFTFAAGLSVSLLAAAAVPIVHLLYGPSFAAAALPMRINAFAIMFTASTFFAWVVLQSSGKPHYAVPFNLFQLCVTALAASVLIPRFHSPGAALSVLVGTAAQAVLLAGWMQRTYSLQFLRPLLSLSTAAAAAMVVSLTSFSAATPAVFLVAAVVLRAVSIRDLQWIVTAWRSSRST